MPRPPIPSILLFLLASPSVYSIAQANPAWDADPPVLVSTGARPELQIPSTHPFLRSSSNAAEGAGLATEPTLGGATTRPFLAAGGMRPFSQVGMAIEIDSLGAGLEIATPLSETLNLRAGGNFFQYGQGFLVDGVTYNAQLHFGSAKATVDWFPFHNGFHISPGVLFSNNHFSASANVPGGASFDLGDQTLTSSPADPIHGAGGLTFSHRFAPTLLVGFENLIPRSGRHISFPIEAGFAYVGQPVVAISFGGTACQPGGCSNAATDPQIQQDVRTEQNTLNNDVGLLRFYPILSAGVAFRF